jgi:hypothetical protein
MTYLIIGEKAKRGKEEKRKREQADIQTINSEAL